MKKESILTLLLIASLIFNFIQYLSESSLQSKIDHLGSSIVRVHETNLRLLAKIDYQEGLSEIEIEGCVAFETMLQEAIEWKPARSGSGGIYDVEILSKALFTNIAHARYTSWDIEYSHNYKRYIELCY